jgi:hypothetical protein
LHQSVGETPLKSKLLLGGVLIIIGFILAVISATGIGPPPPTRDTSAVIVGDQNQPDRREVASMVLPAIAGVSIAAGAALVGIGMGNFRRPKIVPPDSPKAEEAATTRPLNDDGTTMRRGKAGA